jgi:hypothetical protein
MNTSAVAMAADSAVTIGDGQRIYNSALKLFAIDYSYPMGIMVYQGANFCGIPWETVIKEYRSHGFVPHKTIKEQMDHFLDFVHEAQWVCQDHALQETISSLISFIEEVHEAANRRTISSPEIDIQVHFKNCIVEQVARWNKKGMQFGDTVCLADYVKALRPPALEIIQNDNLFSNLNDIWDSFLSAWTMYLFSEEYRFMFSGVVISGFGTTQLLPACVSVEVMSPLLDQRRIRKQTQYEISRERRTGVFTFAQSQATSQTIIGLDAVAGQVITGILHSQYSDTLSNVVNLIQQNFQITEPQKSKIEDQLIEICIATLENAQAKIKEFTDSNIASFHNTLEHLPKDEMALVAETLVNLNSFQKKVRGSAETVGGPIDVAVITRGDGLVWMQRKHYFDAKLNPHFRTHSARV